MSCTTCENGYVRVHPPQHVAWMLGEIPDETMRRKRWMLPDGHLKPSQPTYAACECEAGDPLTQRPKLTQGKIDGLKGWLPRVFSNRFCVPMTSAGIEADMKRGGTTQFHGDFDDWNNS